jgi:PAS domain S-box-containing protein
MSDRMSGQTNRGHELFPVLRGEPIEAVEGASVCAARELSARPTRPPDHEAENRALIDLMRELAASPQSILQKLAAKIIEVTAAHSAGVSLLDDTGTRFYWPAIAGRWANFVGGGTPRDFGPCGTVLDRNSPLVFSHPQVLFPYLNAQPPLEEVLLFPFYVGGKAVGTIWAVTHDLSKVFDGEDARLLEDLTGFATTAYQAFLAGKAAEAALEVTQRLSSIVGHSDDAILTKTLDGTLTSWNRGAEHLFGYSAQEAIGKNVRMLIPAEREDEEPKIISKIRSGEHVDHYDTVRRRKDGTLIHVSLSVSPLKNAANEIVGASKIARDVGVRKELEQTKEVLLNEMKHRVKNNLTTVQSLASRTFRHSSKEEKDAFSSRLRALSSSHDLLTDQKWARAPVDEFIGQALAPFREKNSGRYRFQGPKLSVNSTNALMLGLAIHELATNAIKYGALSNDAGIVELTWEPVRHDAKEFVRISWKEVGGPRVTAPTETGFGSALIKTAFGGDDFICDYRPEGFVCSFVISLDHSN